MKIRKGDQVIVIAGNDKGKTGAVLEVNREKNRVLVEGVNLRWKHESRSEQKPQGERVQRARTRYRLRATAGDAAALWLTPFTGRTHQLRVHVAHAGFALLGDVHYGGPRRVVLADGRVVRAARTMLHCAWLSLPMGRELLVFECAPPEDFGTLWSTLGGSEEALVPRPDE